MPGQGIDRHVHGPHPTLREISWSKVTRGTDKRGSFFVEPFFFMSEMVKPFTAHTGFGLFAYKLNCYVIW